MSLPNLTGYEQFFNPGFTEWLEENQAVWFEFEKMVNDVVKAGWKHYSARTIVEVMVHHSAVREKDNVYKIGNDRAPDLARAYAVKYPHLKNMFEYRRKGWQDFLKALGESNE